MIADLSKQSEAVPVLLRRNKQLESDTAALAAEFKKAMAQRDQLAALCRTLRVRGGDMGV